MTKRIESVLVAVLLATVVVMGTLASRHAALTYDEPMHFRYGTNILKGNAARFVDGTMPFSALNVLPQRAASVLPGGAWRNALARVETGRLVTVLFSALIAWFVYKWARELYGPGAGLFSLLLYSLSPNLIAHSSLITTDAYAAGMVTLSLYCFWRYLGRGGWKLMGLTALVAGLAQLAKYSCVFIYPILGIIVVVRNSSDLARLAGARDWRGIGRRLARFVKIAAVFALVGIAVLNAGFLFDRTFTQLGKYEMKSEAERALQARLAPIGWLPVPVPYPYLEGLDWGKLREETGRGVGSTYLFGELRDVGGFKGYYLFAYLFKEPIALQVLLVLALVLYVARRRRFAFLSNELVLAVPVAFYAIYLNFFFGLQIGIRHALVIFPVIYVFCGSLVAPDRQLESAVATGSEGLRAQPGRRARRVALPAFLTLMVCYLAVSVLSYYPHYIPYFNELVWDRKQAYRILADSNIDWGQAVGYAKAYKAAHPEVYLEEGLWRMKAYRDKHMEEYLHPQFPDSGRIVVAVNDLVGIGHPQRYKWLRERYKPVGHIAYAYLVFEIAPGDSLRGGGGQ
jgi:hypothetical protein